MIGQVVGAYRITAVVGEGGMGTVYLAEHSLIGHQAAIKVLKPEYSHRPEVVDRFFNEARAASGIRHPGIVEIYDFGYHTDNAAYIVMEHLHGESLEARLRRFTRLPVDQALYLLRHVASGLAAAHDQGIVHRDLKPDNIFVVPDPDMPTGERTKILDFGIAKLVAQTPGSFKTSTGTVMGTPAYMAPEQCKGAGRVDSRADLYALGCILFEMLCGRPPFVAEGGGEVMAQHIYELPPSPRAFDPTLSVDMEALVLRLMAKNPDERYQSTREVLALLDRLLASGGPAITPGGSLAVRAATPPPVAAAHTTLGGAARSVPPTAPGKRRVGYLAPILVGVTIAGAVGLFALLGGDGNQVASGPGAVPGDGSLGPPAARPDAALLVTMGHDAAVRPPGAVANKITIEIGSKPKQAEVYRMPEMIRVGSTPYRLSMAPADGELVFVLQKRGYDSETLVLPADRDARELIGLHRTTSGHDRPPTGKPPTGKPPTGKPPTDQPPTGKPPTDKPPKGKPPKDKPPDTHVLDPFDKKKSEGRALDPFSK